jgi:hypothetical protein
MGPVENPPPRIREDLRHDERVTAGAGMLISGGLQSAECCKVAMAFAEQRRETHAAHRPVPFPHQASAATHSAYSALSYAAGPVRSRELNIDPPEGDADPKRHVSNA